MTDDKQQTTNDKRQTTDVRRQTTNDKQHTINERRQPTNARSDEEIETERPHIYDIEAKMHQQSVMKTASIEIYVARNILLIEYTAVQANHPGYLLPLKIITIIEPLKIPV